MTLFKKKPDLAVGPLLAGRVGGVDGPVSSPGPNSGTLTLASGIPQTVPAYAERMGLEVSADAAATGTFVYILLGSTAQRGAVTSTNWDVAIGAGQTWHGQVSQSVWSGPIQLVSTGSVHVGVVEV